MKYLALGSYIAVIWLANWALTQYGFIEIFPGVVAGAGVLFAGAAFSLRDWLQETGGRHWVVGAILAGATLSYFLGATPTIALASGVAFLLSEAADFIIYSPLRGKSLYGAIALSNTVGAVIDSALFLWVAFGSLNFIEGQVIGKLYVMAVSLLIVFIARRAYALLPRYASS